AALDRGGAVGRLSRLGLAVSRRPRRRAPESRHRPAAVARRVGSVRRRRRRDARADRPAPGRGRRDRLGRTQWLAAAVVGTSLLLGGNGLVSLAEKRVASGPA